MNEEELLAELDSKEPAFKEDMLQSPVKSDKPFNKKGNREDLWNKTDFKGKKLSVEDFKRSGKSFAVAYYGDERKISDEVVEKFVKVSKYLSTKGFTFRHYGAHDSKLQNAILAITDIKSASYLPWGNFNPNIVKPVQKWNTKEGYERACGYHAKFNKIPAGIRAKLASQITAMFTEKFNDPINLLLCYNENGDETITKDSKFEDLGNLSFFFRVANNTNIPIYNLKKDDSITKVVEYVKNMEA